MSLGELPDPYWAAKVENRINGFPAEMKALPWWRGTDGNKAKALIETHLELLKPYGFDMKFEVEILTSSEEAIAAWTVARDTSCDATITAVRHAAQDAFRAAMWDTAWGVPWKALGQDAVRTTLLYAARRAASTAASTAVWTEVSGVTWGGLSPYTRWDITHDAAWIAALDASWDAAWDENNIPQNPFSPLWECWKLGAWPIGFVGTIFKIYVAVVPGRCIT